MKRSGTCTCKWPEEAMYCENDCPGFTTPITFTPGVPTEDGWYVVMVDYEGICYLNMKRENGELIFWNMKELGGHDYWINDPMGVVPTILSHAKLPEL